MGNLIRPSAAGLLTCPHPRLDSAERWADVLGDRPEKEWRSGVSLIEWSEALSVGIESIDEQHKKLVAIINELHVAMLDHSAKPALSRIFGELVEYTTSHFGHEERLFAELGYPQEGAHVAEHHRLAGRVMELKRDFDAGNTAVTLEVMRFLRQWLQDHIVGSDKKYGPFLKEKGVR